MFTSRTDWDFRPSSLFSLARQKQERGEEVIDLTESNPTKCGFQYQPDQLFPMSALRGSVLYDPEPMGLPVARRAIADWYERQHVAVEPSRIIITSGTSEAYSYLLKLLCSVGESVAVPKPGYPLFEYLCRIDDVACRQYRLAYDGEWHIDVHSVEDVLSPETKALVLIHPNNPTGSFIKSEERERILSLVQKSGVPLIVDEVFGAFPFGDDERRTGSFAGELETLTFTVNGLSKLAGLPQVKLSWIVLSGPGDLCTAALERLEIIADTYLSVATQVQHSLQGYLADPTGVTTRIRDRVAGNYRSLCTTFSGRSPVSVFRCEGGWNAVLRFPATKSDDKWAEELLARRGVLTHPGHLFDFEVQSCVVLSLLPELGVFQEGIRRIREQLHDEASGQSK